MALHTGWEPDVPESDTTARRYIVDWARFNERLAGDADAVAKHDDVLVTDCGSPNFFLNCIMLLHPDAALDPAPRIERGRKVFARRDGGPFVVVSPWPTPDLAGIGLEDVGHPPLMMCPAGATAPDVPQDLEIRPVQSIDDLRTFEDVEYRAWDSPAFAYPDRILDIAGWRMWVGWCDGEPVATAAAALADGITRVEWIATLPEYRGRGFGEAMTWCATTADPDRDAVLIASDLGRPIYEHMGFRALIRFTLWQGTR